MAADEVVLWLDPAKTSYGVYSVIKEASEKSPRGLKRAADGSAKSPKLIHEAPSPVSIAKALKVRTIATTSLRRLISWGADAVDTASQLYLTHLHCQRNCDLA